MKKPPLRWNPRDRSLETGEHARSLPESHARLFGVLFQVRAEFRRAGGHSGWISRARLALLASVAPGALDRDLNSLRAMLSPLHCFVLARGNHLDRSFRLLLDHDEVLVIGAEQDTREAPLAGGAGTAENPAAAGPNPVVAAGPPAAVPVALSGARR